MNELLENLLMEEWANQSLPRSKEREESMVIQIRSKPTDRLLELGGGSNPLIHPNCDIRQCFDQNGQPTVDFTADFEKSLPIQSEEFDGILCRYALEHITYTRIPSFLAEVFRVLKAGGRAAFVTPNTMAQLGWIQAHCSAGSDNGGTGWDGKEFFEAASEVLFGTLDYPENSHKAFLSPGVMRRLFREAGFVDIKTTPYGERDTDMVIEVVKPKAEGSPGPNLLGSNAWQMSEEEIEEERKILYGDPNKPKPQGVIYANLPPVAQNPQECPVYLPEGPGAVRPEGQMPVALGSHLAETIVEVEKDNEEVSQVVARDTHADLIV